MPRYCLETTFEKFSWRVKNLLQNLDSDVNRFFEGEAPNDKLNRKLSLHEPRQLTVRTHRLGSYQSPSESEVPIQQLLIRKV